MLKAIRFCSEEFSWKKTCTPIVLLLQPLDQTTAVFGFCFPLLPSTLANVGWDKPWGTATQRRRGKARRGLFGDWSGCIHFRAGGFFCGCHSQSTSESPWVGVFRVACRLASSAWTRTPSRWECGDDCVGERGREHRSYPCCDAWVLCLQRLRCGRASGEATLLGWGRPSSCDDLHASHSHTLFTFLMFLSRFLSRGRPIMPIPPIHLGCWEAVEAQWIEAWIEWTDCAQMWPEGPSGGAMEIWSFQTFTRAWGGCSTRAQTKLMRHDETLQWESLRHCPSTLYIIPEMRRVSSSSYSSFASEVSSWMLPQRCRKRLTLASSSYGKSYIASCVLRVRLSKDMSSA